MNAVEIEAAVSDLAAEPFDAAEFPFKLLAAFDKKETTLKRLRKGDSNKSDVPGGVLLQASIHLATCQVGETRATLERLRGSPKTSVAKVTFVLATDGVVLEAEDLASGKAIAPDYPRFAERFNRSQIGRFNCRQPGTLIVADQARKTRTLKATSRSTETSS